MFPRLHTLAFETTPDPGMAGGGEEPVDEPDEGGWGGPSQEEWEQTQQALQYFAELEQQRQAAQQGDGPQFDPWSENPTDQLRELIRQEMAPLHEFTEHSQLTEAEERAMDIIADMQAAEGEFLFQPSKEHPIASPQLARALAEDFLPEAQERYGAGPRAAEAALSHAVKTVREIEQAIGEAYAAREQNQLGTLLNAQRQPPAAGQAGSKVVGGFEGDEMDLVRAMTGTGHPTR